MVANGPRLSDSLISSPVIVADVAGFESLHVYYTLYMWCSGV